MGSRVWTGVYRLAGMSGSLQTVKIQYSDSVLTCTSTVQNSTISEFAFVCGVEWRGGVTFCLGLLTEVQPAGKYVKVCFETPSINR